MCNSISYYICINEKIVTVFFDYLIYNKHDFILNRNINFKIILIYK